MEMKLFCCGGFGVNASADLFTFNGKKNKGCADLNFYYIDTSRSNLIGRSNIDESCLYILDNVDGSGKKRDQNYEALSESAKDILHKFKPGDINIILHSASGGKLAYC